MMLSILTALVGALAGYLLAMRLNKKQRQEEQWWQVFLNLRVLEVLDSDKNENMEEQLYIKNWEKHRELVLRNLVRSDLPEMEEIVRAVNWVGFPTTHARHVELKRLSFVVLRHLDPDYCGVCEKLGEEWAPFREGDVGPQADTHGKPPSADK